MFGRVEVPVRFTDRRIPVHFGCDSNRQLRARNSKVTSPGLTSVTLFTVL
jgi:hypothetical protein